MTWKTTRERSTESVKKKTGKKAVFLAKEQRRNTEKGDKNKIPACEVRC